MFIKWVWVLNLSDTRLYLSKSFRFHLAVRVTANLLTGEILCRCGNRRSLGRSFLDILLIHDTLIK